MPRFASFALVLAFFLPTAHAQQAALWQQEVAYDMDIHLLADQHQLTGQQRLVYTNNSPDTLRQVYYHLYFNAFQPTSLMAERNRQLPDPDRRVVPRIFELGPDEIGFYDVRSLTQDGQPVPFRVDDTVMEVEVAPIPPGTSTTFEMTFRAQVPLQTRRSGRDSREGIDFTMTQWYPKMAAYDAIGWHADPYIGREFYAPFGTFDVRLTLPAEYVVGATGVLQNPEAVGYGYEQSPYLGQTSSGPASSANGAPADSLTWHFRAERVHDFAWSADPEYLHTQILVEDLPGRDEPVQLHFLFQPDVADVWAPLPEQTAELLRFFSQQYGPYPYPQFTVAQGGDGGMEYPMFTPITGRRSPLSLLGVTSHELAHMWFYGLVATNESDYAWMDEGFTNYADTEGVAHVLSGGTAGPVSHAGSRRRIASLQRLGLYERPNKPSDWFETNLAYGAASYSAGEALADLLGYVMGDAARDEFLREYVRRYSFRHPYPADVMSVAQDVSGLQLDWLFEQFLEGAERYDYAAVGLGTERMADGVRSTVTLRRNEEGVLPVDVRLRFEDGTEEFATIPLGVMEGQKPVPDAWTVAAPWGWTFPTYDLVVERPSAVVEAEVDPERRMIDLNPSNNRVRRGGPDVPQEFAGFLKPPPSSSEATTYALSPIGLYSDAYGVGVGAQVRAELANRGGTIQLGVTVWPEAIADEDKGLPDLPPLVPPTDLPPDAPVLFFDGEPTSSPLDGIDYTAAFERRGVLGPLDVLRVDAQKHLGIVENRVSLEKTLGAYPVLRRWDHTLALTVGHQKRVSDRAFETTSVPFPSTFPLATGFAEAHLLSARLDYRIGDDASSISASAELGGTLGRSGLTLSDPLLSPFRFNAQTSYNAARLMVSATRTQGIGPFTGVARFAAGLGSDGLAPQKRFGLGVSSAETRWRAHGYRALAAAPAEPQDDLNFFAFSGVGPIAYLLSEPAFIPFPPAPFLSNRAFGTRMVAGSIAFRTGPIVTRDMTREVRAVFDPLRFEVFSGIGALGFPGGAFVNRLVADAGVGVRYDVGALARLSRVVAQSDVLSGLRLAAKFPVWVSDPERIGPDEDAFGFRWLIGIEAGL